MLVRRRIESPWILRKLCSYKETELFLHPATTTRRLVTGRYGCSKTAGGIEESELQTGKRVAELLDINHDTLWGWIDGKRIDAGEQPGVPSANEAGIKELEQENA